MTNIRVKIIRHRRYKTSEMAWPVALKKFHDASASEFEHVETSTQSSIRQQALALIVQFYDIETTIEIFSLSHKK